MLTQRSSLSDLKDQHAPTSVRHKYCGDYLGKVQSFRKDFFFLHLSSLGGGGSKNEETFLSLYEECGENLRHSGQPSSTWKLNR